VGSADDVGSRVVGSEVVGSGVVGSGVVGSEVVGSGVMGRVDEVGFSVKGASCLQANLD